MGEELRTQRSNGEHSGATKAAPVRGTWRAGAESGSCHRSIPSPRRLAGILVLGAGLLTWTVDLNGAANPAAAGARPPAKTNAAPLLPRPTVKTNPLPARPMGMVPTNLPPGRPGIAGKTNLSAAGRTNALTGAKTPAAKGGSGLAEQFRQFQSNTPVFYGVVGGLILGLTALLGFLAYRAKAKKATAATDQGLPSPITTRPLRKPKAGKVTIHSCNVLQTGADARQLWQFDARGGRFVLNREQTTFAGETLPSSLVKKSWRAVWHHKLNIAWLPPERVFLRVAQFPLSTFDETLAMVELQLEKLSPIPVAQVVWSIQVLPHAKDNMQTVIVMITARDAVEEFLGQLEGQGYLADRLELPVLDQLQATEMTGDGVWIYPEAVGRKNTALAAWCYGGVLQNLDLVTLPATDRPASLKEQLLQMAWAGEMEGWLTAPPRWHLVADESAAAEWEPALREGLEQPVAISAPLPAPQLAALTARRAAQAPSEANLLPADFSARYQQQFRDRLWMRGLGAIVAVYLLYVLYFFGKLEIGLYRTRAVEADVAALGPTYTNAIQIRDRYKVLKDRQELKFAGLDCWNTTARLMPESLTLESMNFSDGRKLSLSGTGPADAVKDLLDFEAKMRKETVDGQLLFDPAKGDNLSYQVAGPGSVRWNFSLELKRVEVQ